MQIFSRTNILIGQNFEILHKITNQGFLANVIQNFGVVLFINKHDTYQIHEKLIISKHTIKKSHIETKCAHSRQCSNSKAYLAVAKVDQSTQKPLSRPLSRPRLS